MKGQIYRKNTLSFLVKLEDGTFSEFLARGNLKRGENFLYVGDFVEVDNQEKVINKILERKNLLIRPYVSNVDAIFIVIAKIPKPDFILIDKQIIIANKQNIPVYIIINKIDLKNSDKLIDKVKEEYKNVCKVIEISAEKQINLDLIKDIAKDKLVALSGQSATGKSSIIKAISEFEIGIGELSKKTNRGKNTTRMIQIFDVVSSRIIDTCGFSSFEIEDIKKKDLAKYYSDFKEFSNSCYFNNCTHIKEENCQVKNALKNGKININRYQRYLEIFNFINDKEY